MTYWPWTKQVILKTAGIVFDVKLVSLKQSCPWLLSVVFETYMENPRNSFANVFVGPEIKQCLANRNDHSFKLRLKKNTIQMH